MVTPLFLKATAGGGGKGMRVVWKKLKLRKLMIQQVRKLVLLLRMMAFTWRNLLRSHDILKYKLQVIRYGKVCHLSERDCSIQRRHQKLVEESPSPFMTPELRKAMGEAAIKAASAINYESVGTIEFLVDKHRNFYFMEMNTRIQVEHCVTEEVINYDLNKEQIKIAVGESISGKNYDPQMHAIECRINAEDPYNDFRPSPGKNNVFCTNRAVMACGLIAMYMQVMLFLLITIV